jgi:hypothetical protein
MKQRRFALVLAVAPIIALAQTPAPAPAPATPPAPKPALYLFREEVAIPSALANFESASKEMLAMMTEKKIDDIRFTTWMTRDFHFLYAIKLDNVSALDKFPATWKAYEPRAAATTSSYNESIVMHRPDLSYSPAAPRVKPDEVGYVRWQIYYLVPGHDQEAEQIAKDYSALFKAKNISSGFQIYQGWLGSELPMLIATINAKSAADFAVADEKDRATLGDAILPLQARALAITRRYEEREAIFRRDLSYPTRK